MARALRLLLLALMLAAVADDAAAEVLTPDEFRRAGYVALTGGNAAQALAIAEALLARDPGDVTALILRSRALRDLGRTEAARAAAEVAWAASTTDEQRYGAALAMAQALSSAGNRTLAQFWLRRAVQAAPNALARQIAERDFDYVRGRNPLSWSFDLSARPSSNVNGGSSNTVTELLGLPFVLSGDARALSGYELAAGVALGVKLPAAQGRRSDLRLAVEARHYWLSADAQAQAPGAEGSDYDFAAIELGWSGRTSTADGKLAFSYGVTAGRNWYGWAPMSNYLRLDAGAERRLGQATLGQVRAHAEFQDRADDTSRSATVLGLTGGLIRQLGNGDRLRLSLGVRDTSAESSSIRHRAWLGGLEWDKAAPVKGVHIGAGLNAEARDYPEFPLVAGGRQDLTLSLGLSLGFPNIEYLGFSPVLEVNASHTESSVGLYDSQTLGVGFGIRSNF